MRGDAEANGEAGASRTNRGCGVTVCVRFEARVTVECSSALAEHVPYDREVCAKNTTEWFEDRICAEWDIVPGEVCTATAEDNSEANRRDDACSVDMIRLVVRIRVMFGTYARPMQKIRLSSIFFFVCNCRCQIIGTGIKKIQISVIRLEMLVKYVKVTMTKHLPVTFASQ